MPSENLYLMHHGVKGMKWGVRRYQNADGSLTPAGKRKAAKDRYKKDLRDAAARQADRDTKRKQPYYRMLDPQHKKDIKNAEERRAKEDPKFQKKLLKKREKKATEFSADYSKRWTDLYNKAADKQNAELDRINAKYKDKDIRDWSKGDGAKYVREVGKAWKKNYEDVLLSEMGEHPTLGKEWVKNAMFYDMYNPENFK